MAYKKIERMTTFMRINHWVVAFSMVGAIATGLYIGHPYYSSMMADPAATKWVMAWNRWWHFMIAIVFDVSSIVVAYMYFFSRFEKPYKKLLPTGKNISEFFAVLINLITFNRSKNFDSSHFISRHIILFCYFKIIKAQLS
jgi:Ni,Fe-hydrogenase I cytochrome b subunit